MKSSPHRHQSFRVFVRSSYRRIFLFPPVVALLLAQPSLALQREPNTPPKSATAEPTTVTAHELTATDLEVFLDGLMPLSLERDDIAGAVVAVVKDGKLLFAKGYGYADVATKKPVSPDSTLFRPGSVSKLFTWTAVMQLMEQGKLNLDHDVNDYLDFKIPATYPQPITLRHIMTHTAGFGEAIKDLFIKDSSELQPLGTYLATHIPNRIFPPGTTPAYSNYATSLAGYIVERISGKPFNDYVRDNILAPLGMEKTTFAQPLPENLKSLVSSGYILASGKAKPFEVVQAWPAGSVSTAATDMARFMIAHLQNGELNGARILRPETATLMHSRQFSPNPALNGMALGFYEETRNGHRIIGHAGDTICFHTDLHLLVNDGVGFFVSYNSPGKGISNRTALWHKFLDRYFPYQIPATPPLATAAADAREVAGNYIVSRREQGNMFEGLSLLSQATVTAGSDGTISISSLRDFAGQLKKFYEIQPLVYQEVDGQDRVAFQRDAGSRLTFATDFPVFVFQRAGGLQLGPLNLFLLGASAAILLLALLFWPVAALVRRHFRTKLHLGKRELLLRVAVRLVCALDLVFLLSIFLVLTSLQGNLPTSHITGTLHFIQVIGLLGALGTLIALYNAWRIWRSAGMPVLAKATAAASAASGESTETTVPVSPAVQSRWWGTKVFEALIALACLGFVWFCVYWNLFNFASNF
jgi:CubicO group peptidase (beta-lactamase class C family)